MAAQTAYGLYNVYYAGSGRALAAGTGDATKVTSIDIDRLGYMSGTLVISGQATLQEAKTLSFTIDIQDCSTADGTFASYKAVAKTAYATGDSGGSTDYFCIPVDVNLEGADRYLNIDITPDLSATGTDTATWAATMILAGPVESVSIPISHSSANGTLA
jgi:hypothetical protein